MSLYRRPHSPHWWVRFQLDGREIRLSTRTENRAAAQEFEVLARTRAYRQIRLGERPAYPWKDATRRWLNETRKRSKDVDERIIEWLDDQFEPTTVVQDISREVIDELRALKAGETSESTADRYMALLRAILKKCEEDWGVLERAPKVPMYRPERGEPKWLRPAQFAALVTELPPHLKPAAQFAVLTGLRMRSMLSLKWDQVDMRKRRAWIYGASMKGKDTHGIPLSADAMKVLRKIKREGDWVFTFRGERIADCNTAAFQKAVARAKVGPLRWHDLRHTWASWAISGGAQPLDVMQLGGWKSLAMVARYTHLAPDHLARAASVVKLPGMKTGTAKKAAGARS